MFNLQQINVITGDSLERRARGNCPPPLNPALVSALSTKLEVWTALKNYILINNLPFRRRCRPEPQRLPCNASGCATATPVVVPLQRQWLCHCNDSGCAS